MAVTAHEVQKLREMTGAGILDCQKALIGTQGDIEKAIQALREKGKASASTKAGRSACQGVICSWTSEDGKKGSLIELNCETDFVARTKDFQELARGIAKTAALNSCKSAEDLLREKISGSGENVDSFIKEKIGKLGENMVLKKAASFGGDGLCVGNYIHSPYEGATDCGKLGVLIEVKTSLNGSSVGPLLRELSMQIAATSPKWIRREDVPAQILEKEKGIYLEQCKGMGKPEAAWPKITEGKLKDFYKQFCLLEQLHVRDAGGKTTVGTFIESSSKELVGSLTLLNMVRFKVGES